MVCDAKRLMTAGALVCGVAVIAYLALFDPVSHPAPRCIFNALTGWQCPGCGTQRAVHAALNGRFAVAWSENPAVFFAAPLAVLYACSPKRLEKVLYSPVAFYAIASAVVLWWVLRNVF